jgi:hypothetical protein
MISICEIELKIIAPVNWNMENLITHEWVPTK